MNIFLKPFSMVIFLFSCSFLYPQNPQNSRNEPVAETQYMHLTLTEKRFSLSHTNPVRNSTSLKEKIKDRTVIKRSVVDFSLGAGAAFHYNFAVAEFLLSANLGFKLSRHFALVNGVEFVFWNNSINRRMHTGLYIAPSYYLPVKKFIFYAGGGVCGWLPDFLPTLNLFLMTSTGYHISESMLLKLSVRVPVYGEGMDLTGAVMYSFLF